MDPPSNSTRNLLDPPQGYDSRPDQGHNTNGTQDGVHASRWNPAGPAREANPHSMELDVVEEDHVSQLLDPTSPPGNPSSTSAGFLRTLQREIRTSIQESVQSYIHNTVTTALKDTVGQALVEYHGHGAQEAHEDADDESDPPPGASPRGRKSKRVNDYHNVLRGFLASKGLWVTGDGSIPQLPPAEDIKAFVSGREGGPRVEAPRFDWTEPFSHVWNDELLGMLADEWTPIIEEKIGRDELPDEFFEFDWVKRTMAIKLRGVKTAFLRRFDRRTGTLREAGEVQQLETNTKTRCLLRARHTSRSTGTFQRRGKIIQHQKNVGHNPEFWIAAEEVLQLLGRRGMSSDESEEEAPTEVSPYSRSRKVVRRVPLQWLRGEIATLWKYVEEHYTSLPPRHRRGNPPYARIFEASPPPPLDMARAQHLVVVKNLPTNWYDPLYWSHLTPQGKKAISRSMPRTLPTIPDASMGD